ncbi:hypothetical protein [Nocardia pseudovaccinii]|uniref:magnesium chelatase subunit ChlI family protein n=1 Tax=Nocardia pseudovaccinii TaxID=189540 RepID=UPI0009FD46C8
MPRPSAATGDGCTGCWPNASTSPSTTTPASIAVSRTTPANPARRSATASPRPAAAARRWREHGHTTNARVPVPLLRQQFPLSRTEAAPVEAALRLGRITRHGADRTLAVAATIADLRGAEGPSTHDIVEALHLRGSGTP